MNTTSIAEPKASLLAQIKKYKKRATEISDYLNRNPLEWGRFQSEFNQEVNSFFREIMLFEKESQCLGDEEKLYKLKQFFVVKLRKDFLRGELIRWSYEKPYGYAGDHKIIDDIYRNTPATLGFDRLFDNYFQMSVISVAVRNRKEDFKKIVRDYAEKHRGSAIRVMDIASGPCRDVKETLLDRTDDLFEKTEFDCLDADHRSIEYAGKLLNHDKRVHFTHMNIVRLALTKNPHKEFPYEYDVIYSTGLFDYLDERISTKLIHNLRQLLKPGGILAISDVRDKFSNPSVYFMEWVGDWNLVYRDDDVFRRFFVDAGFEEQELTFNFEQQGVLQYVFAKKTD